MTSRLILNNDLQAPFLPQMEGKILDHESVFANGNYIDLVIPRPPRTFDLYAVFINWNGYQEGFTLDRITFPHTYKLFVGSTGYQGPFTFYYSLLDYDSNSLTSPVVNGSWIYD